MQTRTGGVMKLVFIDLVGSVVAFPIWWYTRGIQGFAAWCIRALRFSVKKYALGLWVRSFFVPMYGQYDWVGRVISVLARFVVLIGRCLALAVEAALYAVVLFLWLILPIAAVLLLIGNMIGGMTLAL